MIRMMWLMIAVTFTLSVYNWYEEGHFIGFFVANVGAVFSGAIAIGFYTLSVNRMWSINNGFKLAAFFSVFIGLLVYSYYAINGQAENSSSSSAQMHIILFPILHAVITVFLFIFAACASFVLKVFGKTSHTSDYG